MKILHISDLHFPTLLNPFTLRRKSLVGYANFYLRRRKKHLQHKILVETIRNLNYDALIISGDITNVSHPKEFEIAKEILSPILDERTFMIPGNHDRYTKKSITEDYFEKSFSEYLGDKIEIDVQNPMEAHEARITEPELEKRGSLTESFDFNRASLYLRMKTIASMKFIGWDSNLLLPAMNAQGLLHPLVAQKTLDIMSQSKKSEYMLVCHHPIWNPKDRQESNHHKMRNRESIIQILKSNPPIAYFHGHLHTNWVKTPDENVPFYVINSASSTRISDSHHKSGFHFFNKDNKNDWTSERYIFNSHRQQFELSNSIIYS